MQAYPKREVFRIKPCKNVKLNLATFRRVTSEEIRIGRKASILVRNYCTKQKKYCLKYSKEEIFNKVAFWYY